DLLRRLDMRDRAFGWPVEMVVKTAANGARILEVPVSHAPRQAGRSKVSGTLRGTLRAGYAFLSIALRPRGRSRGACTRLRGQRLGVQEDENGEPRQLIGGR